MAVLLAVVLIAISAMVALVATVAAVMAGIGAVGIGAGLATLGVFRVAAVRRWRYLTAVDRYDPEGRTPLLRMYDDFMDGFTS